MILSGERVVLRPVQPADFPYVVEWTKNEQVGHFAADDGYPESIAECEQWYKKLLANRHNQVFIIQAEDGHPIGDVEFDQITWRSGDAELRIRIGDPRYWNRGYGTETVRAMVKYGFEELNLQRIYLRVSKNNPRALRCYEKAHFRKEGKVMRRVGNSTSEEVVYLMRILKGEYLQAQNKGHLGQVS